MFISLKDISKKQTRWYRFWQIIWWWTCLHCYEEKEPIKFCSKIMLLKVNREMKLELEHQELQFWMQNIEVEKKHLEEKITTSGNTCSAAYCSTTQNNRQMYEHIVGLSLIGWISNKSDMIAICLVNSFCFFFVDDSILSNTKIVMSNSFAWYTH